MDADSAEVSAGLEINAMEHRATGMRWKYENINSLSSNLMLIRNEASVLCTGLNIW